MKHKILLFGIVLFALKSFSQETYQPSEMAIHRVSGQVYTFKMIAKQLNCKKKIWLYLPKNYFSSKKKFPVIYMHDAQNLFNSRTAFAGEWNVDETLDSINAQVIVVGIEHGNEKRIEELTPFKNQKHGGGNADNYLDFIVKNLKPHIDSLYRTKTTSKHTCIFGSSLGGLVSFYAILKYPNVFGKAGVFSPSFWFNRDEIVVLLKQKKEFKSKIYFLCGDNEGDADMLKDLNNIEYLINNKRCSCLKLNKKVIVKNGQHNEKLWRESFKKAYLWLL
jgi:predicted alpha/beta superfamily hydrolase